MNNLVFTWTEHDRSSIDVAVSFLFICVLSDPAGADPERAAAAGLSSAFGGAGGNTAFGAKTGDVLTWATSIVFALSSSSWPSC
jgi:hypothetical protein